MTDTSYLFGSSYIGNVLKTANMCRQGIPNLSNILHEQKKVEFSFTLTSRVLLNRGITRFFCDTDWPVCKTTHSVFDVLKTSYLERSDHSVVRICSQRIFTSSPHDKVIHVFLLSKSYDVLKLTDPFFRSAILDNSVTLLSNAVAGVTGVHPCLIPQKVLSSLTLL